MARQMTKEDSEAQWLDVIRQMKDFTGPSLSQICGTLDESTRTSRFVRQKTS